MPFFMFEICIPTNSRHLNIIIIRIITFRPYEFPICLKIISIRALIDHTHIKSIPCPKPIFLNQGENFFVGDRIHISENQKIFPIFYKLIKVFTKE